MITYNEIFDDIVNAGEKIYRDYRNHTYVNCWHMNEFESDAMWKIYLKSDEGIAIQSTYNRLINSFDPLDDKIINVGIVSYIDYSKQSMPFDGFSPFIYKRVSYSFENELRALLQYRSSENNAHKFIDNETLLGLPIKVNLNMLIENIFVSPYSPKWIYSSIVNLLDRLNLQYPIKRSSMLDKSLI